MYGLKGGSGKSPNDEIEQRPVEIVKKGIKATEHDDGISTNKGLNAHTIHKISYLKIKFLYITTSITRPLFFANYTLVHGITIDFAISALQD